MADAVRLAAMLRDLVDVLIPGRGPWPAASLVGVQGILAMRLFELRGEAALEELAGAVETCGGPLAPLGEAERVEVVRRVEAAEPALFKDVRVAAYLAYYESPAVIVQIRALGQPYAAVPILQGYPQEPFDPQRDRPRHNRGAYVRTEDVRRVDPPPAEEQAS